MKFSEKKGKNTVSYLVVCSLIMLGFLSSCAGYKLRSRENPFAQYGIHTIAVPQFYNQSNVNGASRYFSKGIIHLLQSFQGLKVVTKESASADAYLIGILKSPKNRRDTLSRHNELSASRFRTGLTETRQDILIPTTNRLNMILSLVLIKNPTKEELEFLQTDIGEQVTAGKKIVFQEHFPVRGAVNREIYRNDDSVVNSTQSDAMVDKNLMIQAENTAIAFRNRVLYVF